MLSHSNQIIIKKTLNDHSTGPDILTGWSQKQLIPKLNQIPLIFANNYIDIISKSLTSFGSPHPYRVVYMGPRYESNMKVFKAYSQNNKQTQAKQSEVYGMKKLQRFQFNHSHQKDKFFPIRASEYRLFTGVNPTCQKTDLRFDSQFQSGNLDLAIYINPAQYDLIMRVDSNTRGHTSWFYFKVSNSLPKQKIKFNIINFAKSYNLYKQGMKPYVFKKSKGIWTQQRKFRYDQSQNPRIMGSLSFTYNFIDNQQVYFAYCIPYSYSFLLSFLNQIKEKHSQFIKIQLKDQSAGGLPIPVLTITNFSTSDANKKIHLCTGRLHPGQTQGSWMMHGFIKFLCSPDGHYLRQRIVFKIIPMVNVDGVVLGNFRTGIGGRDLNRAFYQPEKYQQIKLIRSLAQNFKPAVFIDFHGHSSKKNVFLYGPDYKIQNKNYLSSRIFAKLISKKTQAFRYYSCSFKISTAKDTTGRAVLLRQHQTPFSFTIEASTHCFGSLNNQKLFIAEQYRQMGTNIGRGLNDFIFILSILPKRALIKMKKNQEKNGKNGKKSYKLVQKAQKNILNNNLDQGDGQFKDFYKNLSQQQYQMFSQLININDQQNFDDNKSIDEAMQDSDCQDQKDDYSEKQLDKYFNSNGKYHLQKVKEKQYTQKNKKTKISKSKQKTSKIKKQSNINTEIKSTVQTPIKKKKVQRNFELKRNSPQQNISQQYLNSHLLQKSKTIDHQRQQFYRKFQTIQNNIFNKLQSQQFLSPQQIKHNNVMYNWQNRSRSSVQGVIGKNFSLNTLNMSPSQYQKIQSIQKQKNKRIDDIIKKPQPFIKIKKSILPLIGKSENISEYQPKSLLGSVIKQRDCKKNQSLLNNIKFYIIEQKFMFFFTSIIYIKILIIKISKQNIQVLSKAIVLRKKYHIFYFLKFQLQNLFDILLSRLQKQFYNFQLSSNQFAKKNIILIQILINFSEKFKLQILNLNNHSIINQFYDFYLISIR